MTLTTDTGAPAVPPCTKSVNATLSRRSLVGMLAAAPVAITAPASALPAPSAGWDAAVAAYRAASAQYESFFRHSEPVFSAHAAALPNPASVDLIGFTVRDRGAFLHVKDLDALEREVRGSGREQAIVDMQLRTIDRVRGYRAERAAIDQRFGINELIAQDEAILDRKCDAEERVALAQAPDLAAVIFKIEHARERWCDFEDWPDAWWAAVMADLRWLAGEVQ